MKRRKRYIIRAKQRFLAGTHYRAPIDAVQAGVRTLEDWALILAEEREAAKNPGLPPTQREWRSSATHEGKFHTG